MDLFQIIDILIAVGSAALAGTSLPILINKDAQVPRKSASIPSATILTYFVPLFYLEGLLTTALTLAAQAIVWWLIAIYRPIKEEKQ